MVNPTKKYITTTVTGYTPDIPTVDIQLTTSPATHRYNTEIQFLLWTDVSHMLQYLTLQPGGNHRAYSIVHNSGDISKASAHIYTVLKFPVSPHVLPYYAYIFKTPRIFPHYDAVIVGWSVSGAYVKETISIK